MSNKNNENYIPKPCGGRGTCGKCKIKITKGNVEPNERDKKFLTEKEISNNYRIACGHTLDDSVEFVAVKENFKTVSTYSNGNIISAQNENANNNNNQNINFNNNSYSIIIDVGTTTICSQLLDFNSEPIKTISLPNSQRAFGADVLSRISKASAGGFPHLCNMLKSDLKKAIYSLCENITDTPKNIYIAGNTTMTYFLRQMDCRGLGSYPFENNAKDVYETDSKSFLGNDFKFSADITILPCIHAFVGGDIVSGAYFLNLDKERNSLFIDIGTNGEIILNSNGTLYCSSVAAGPAFEGGSISCGTGGIEGAINSIKYVNNNFEYTTIGNTPPVGICGSALIDLLAELLENNFIDKTGLLADSFFSTGVTITGKVKLTEKDIRQLQLAKSAIYSGIQCILSYAKTTFSEIEKVFIGGGFGFYLNLESAFRIKMLPEEFRNKIYFCGNTCLGGLAKLNKTKSSDYLNFITSTKPISLAETDEFQSYFIENLNF